MIRVTIELISAVNGSRRELARMDIANDATGTVTRGNYDGVTYRGRDKGTLDKGTPQKVGRVENYPREAYHVWNLIYAMLGAMGYTNARD